MTKHYKKCLKNWIMTVNMIKNVSKGPNYCYIQYTIIGKIQKKF